VVACQTEEMEGEGESGTFAASFGISVDESKYEVLDPLPDCPPRNIQTPPVADVRTGKGQYHGGRE